MSTSQNMGYEVAYDCCGKCLHYREEHPFPHFCMIEKHVVGELDEACGKFGPRYDVKPGESGRRQ